MRMIDSSVAVLTILLGVWVAWTATGYGYTSGPGPGPGFFPFWVGTAMAVLGVVNLYRSLARIEVLTEGFETGPATKSLISTGIVAAFVVAAPVVGMIPGSVLMIPAIAFTISPTLERGFLLRLAAASVCFPLVVWLLFSVYLDIRLVEGFLGF